jgi:MFS family permease
MTDFIKGDTAYYFIALASRLVLGTGDQFIQTTTYSVLSSTFPNRREKILGYAETAAGVGLVIGPVIGGILNTWLKYFLTYLIFAGMLAINGIIVFVFMPNELNNNPEITEYEINVMSQKASKKINYWMFIKNRRCLFALLSCTILNFFVLFKQAFVTIVLDSIFGIPEKYHGWMIALPPLFQIIGALLVGNYIEKAPKRIFIVTAFLILTLSDFLMGPSKIL